MVLQKAKAPMTCDGLISIETTQMGSSPEIIADWMISIHTHTRTHIQTHTQTHRHTQTHTDTHTHMHQTTNRYKFLVY